MPVDPYIGEIMLFAGDFPPRGWADCHGQLLPVAQYTALYSILGVRYGGDGRTTFALPDLRDRFPMGSGQGVGLSSRQPGFRVGTPSVTLYQDQLPSHAHHVAPATSSPALGRSPAGTLFARGEEDRFAPPTAGTNVPMGGTLAPVGGGAPHENRQPWLSLRFVIALQGVFPPRP